MKTMWLGSVLLVAFFCPSAPGQSEDVWIDSLDKPTRTEVVDLGPSPTNLPGQRLRVRLTCFFYPGFMVKEVYEEMNKGMTSEVVVPLTKGTLPHCTQSSVPGEMSLGKPDWENDAFVGAKGNLLFFEWVDGNNRGRPFSILDATSGKLVYEDVAYDPRIWRKRLEVHPFDRLRVITAQDGSMSLKYLHVEAYDCDLNAPTERSTCWEKIRVQADLKNRQIPVCSDYERIHSQYWSAVAYPVEVLLRPRPRRRTIAGPVGCWPRD
jgi:hypothetical protein